MVSDLNGRSMPGERVQRVNGKKWACRARYENGRKGSRKSSRSGTAEEPKKKSFLHFSLKITALEEPLSGGALKGFYSTLFC